MGIAKRRSFAKQKIDRTSPGLSSCSHHIARQHITTIVRLIDAQQVRGQSGTITAAVNALARAGIELGENRSTFPRAKGKPSLAK